MYIVKIIWLLIRLKRQLNKVHLKIKNGIFESILKYSWSRNLWKQSTPNNPITKCQIWYKVRNKNNSMENAL